MDFGGFMRRDKTMNKAFDDLGDDVGRALEVSLIEIDDAVGVEMLLGDEDADGNADEKGGMIPAGSVEGATQQLTIHTKNRLSALATFEGFYQSAQERLRDMNGKLSEVTTLQGSMRYVMDILHAEIHRANDLELANLNLLGEHRTLLEQYHESSAKHQEREHVLERVQLREANLIQEVQSLRTTLASAKLEAVEAVSAAARSETELAELSKAIAAKNTENDRRARENEALRDKNVGLSIELDRTTKQEADTRHKLEDVSRTHAAETMRNSELTASLRKAEKEVIRLQKALDLEQMRHSELQENARMAETERETDIARTDAEIRSLRTDVTGVQARLEQALDENVVLTNELAELRVHLNDARADRFVLDERLSALSREAEADKASLSAVNATLSEMSMRQTSEQIELDIRIQECDDLRAEIASLNTQIQELLPYQRLHRVTAARQRDGATNAVVDFGPLAADAARAAVRRSTGSGRQRARSLPPAE